MIRGEGLTGRLATGTEQAYQSARVGQWLGTKGLNPIIQRLGGEGIDPLSAGGRAIDAGLRGGTAVATEVYHQLSGDTPTPSAGTVFNSRVTAREAA